MDFDKLEKKLDEGINPFQVFAFSAFLVLVFAVASTYLTDSSFNFFELLTLTGVIFLVVMKFLEWGK